MLERPPIAPEPPDTQQPEYPPVGDLSPDAAELVRKIRLGAVQGGVGRGNELQVDA